jgi:hypothetical protein
MATDQMTAPVSDAELEEIFGLYDAAEIEDPETEPEASSTAFPTDDEEFAAGSGEPA